MKATDRLVLPEDVALTPIAQIATAVRSRLAGQADDVVVTRHRSRATSQIIDGGAAAFLAEFRRPTTIVEAVLAYAGPRDLQPAPVLDAAYPLIERLARAGFLVEESAANAGVIEPLLAPGVVLDGCEALELIQVLEDSEVWRGQRANQPVAIKLSRNKSGSEALAREIAALERLGGPPGPDVIATGRQLDHDFLASSWCAGLPFEEAARTLRERDHGSVGLLGLCRAVVESVASIHGRGVVHGDVHPRNFIVGEDGAVRVVDFGLSRLDGAPPTLTEPGRGAVGYYVEPEYAAALLDGLEPPAASRKSDQYGLGVMAFRAMTGEYPIDFDLDRESSWRQIAREAPRSFAACGRSPWPSVEAVVARALNKDPLARYADLTEFAHGLASSAQTRPSRRQPSRAGEELVDRVAARYADLSLDSDDLLAPRASLNYGAAGIAYGLLRLAAARAEPALLAAADVWVTRAEADRTKQAYEADELGLPRRLGQGGSLLHSPAGVAFAAALAERALGSGASGGPWIETFISRSSNEDGDLDATTGQASSLLGACGLMEVYDGSDVELGPLRLFGESILEHLRTRLLGLGPITDGGLRYLGFAHGWAGILYAAMRWSRVNGAHFPNDLGERCRELAAQAIAEGTRITIPLEADPSKRTGAPWAGWCHGSAGHVLFATAAAETLNDGIFTDLAVSLGGHVAEQSDRNVGQLCCGLAGQAYALATLARSSGDPRWHRVAERLAHNAALNADVSAHRRGSLFKGDLGIALMVSDLKGDRGGFPLVEPEI